MNRSADRAPLAEARLKRLAENIDALAEKDAGSERQAREIADLRSQASAQIYGICSDFVLAINRLLSEHLEVLNHEYSSVKTMLDTQLARGAV